MNIKSILAAITISALTPGIASAAFCAFVAGGFSPPTGVTCGATSGSVSADGPTDKVRALKTAGAAGKRVEVRGRDQNNNFLHAAPKCQAIATAIGVVAQNPNNQLCNDVPPRLFNGVLGRAES
jgi:energy-coupling factor transporter ATP-binding protein EcfA2